MQIEIKEIEIAHLDLCYGHTRIRDNRAIRRFCASLETHGQLTPVVVVSREPIGHILLDGYLRVAALKRLGRDFVTAEIHRREAETLIRIICRTQARRWEFFEYAEVIREMMHRFDYSQADMARLLGKSESFISRRLQVLESLDEAMREHVRKGHISIWSATRVLAPLARANPDHAAQLARNIIVHPYTTRELMEWFKAYRRATRKNRSVMIENPRMVLDALKVKAEEKETENIRAGPEGRWTKDIEVITHMLKRLIREVDAVFYENQSNLDRRSLMTAFDTSVRAFDDLTERIRRANAVHRNRKHHPGTVRKGDVHPKNQPDFEAFQENSSTRPEQNGALSKERITP